MRGKASFRALISILIGLLLFGCEAAGTRTDLSPAATTANAEYVLGTGDKIRIIVFGEQSLSGEFQVDAAGSISMPLIGPQRAAGQTPSAFSNSLTRAFKAGYLRDPKVSIEVLNARPFFILGEVTKPGEYPYKDGMNAVSAVATAGGYTYRANTEIVYIRRANDIQEKRYIASTGISVLPGDIVRIPERYF